MDEGSRTAAATTSECRTRMAATPFNRVFRVRFFAVPQQGRVVTIVDSRDQGEEHREGAELMKVSTIFKLFVD